MLEVEDGKFELNDAGTMTRVFSVAWSVDGSCEDKRKDALGCPIREQDARLHVLAHVLAGLEAKELQCLLC
jgi:hypothetical protein